MGVPEVDIDALHAAWCEAIRREDVEAALGLLTDDYVLWAAGAPPVTGHDSIRTLFSGALARYRISPSFESEECLASGDLAVARGWDRQRIEPREGGEAIIQSQRVFLVMVRGDDGRWRYARGMSQPGPGVG